ncbi:hypothetical protein QEN19_002777 [Hanseniaspora menglaensis]
MSFYNNSNNFDRQQRNSQFYSPNQQNIYMQQQQQHATGQMNGYPHQGFNNNTNEGNSMAGNVYAAQGSIPSMSSRSPDEILPSGLLNALSTKGYSDELPLMQELGINFSNIWQNTMNAVLFKQSNSGDMSNEDVDLAGPLFFVILYGALLYIYSGKLHFGYIYGVGLFGTVSIHFLLKLMSNPSHTNENISVNSQKDNSSIVGMNFLQTCSILGYSFLPLCILSGIGIFSHLNSSLGLILSLLIVSWCAVSSSGEFVKFLSLHNVRLLVAYPLFIFYSVFASMIVFG